MSMANMTEATKHMPDYYCASGHLVEVVGCGRDKTLKFRTSKFTVLNEQWDDIQPCAVFVWNSHLKIWALVFWPEFVDLYTRAVNEHGVKEFHDGNRYVPIKMAEVIKAAAQHGEFHNE